MGKIFINKNGKTHIHTLSTEKKSSSNRDYRLSFLQGDKIIFDENFQEINYGDCMFCACNVESIKGTLIVQNTANYMFSGSSITWGSVSSVKPKTRLKEVDIKCTTTEAKNMFSHNEKLETIKLELPNAISCYNICHSCPELRHVEIQAPEATTLSGAFNNCPSLEHVDVSSFTKCDNFETTFYGCKNLKSVVLPTLNHTIKHRMFKDCISLESLELNFIIDNSVAEYAGFTAETFDNCVSLHTISGDWSGVRNFANTESIVGLSPEAVFEDCCSLRNFTADVSDLSIGDDMFYNCVSLENFTSSIASLTTGNNMFLRCKLNLQSVTNIINSLMTENENTNGGSRLTLGVDKNIKNDVTSFLENKGIYFIQNGEDETNTNSDLMNVTNAVGNSWIIEINWN